MATPRPRPSDPGRREASVTNPRRPAASGGRGTSSGSSAQQKAEDAGAEAKEGGKKGLTMAARLGYAARGVVYLMVGWLALAAAFGLGGGGQTTGARGAIQAFLSLPGGTILTGIVAVGLAGFALWRLVAAATDADGHGGGGKGIAIRIGLAVSGLLHGVLALYAGSLVWGTPTAAQASSGGGASGSAGGGSGGYTAQLMAEPWGRWVIVAVGLIALGVAGAQVNKAIKKKYRRNLSGSVQSKGWLDPVSRAGLSAKAFTLALIGVFLIGAAWSGSSAQAQQAGLPEALSWVQSQPWGQWLLGLLAIGLICFGLYGLIMARWRIIPDPET